MRQYADAARQRTSVAKLHEIGEDAVELHIRADKTIAAQFDAAQFPESDSDTRGEHRRLGHGDAGFGPDTLQTIACLIHHYFFIHK